MSPTALPVHMLLGPVHDVCNVCREVLKVLEILNFRNFVWSVFV